MATILDKSGSVFNHFIAEIRDAKIQQDPIRFRRNMERIGEVMAYEISKKLEFETFETQTPLGIATTSRVKSQVVLATILRAGLPLHSGKIGRAHV